MPAKPFGWRLRPPHSAPTALTWSPFIAGMTTSPCSLGLIDRHLTSWPSQPQAMAEPASATSHALGMTQAMWGKARRSRYLCGPDRPQRQAAGGRQGSTQPHHPPVPGNSLSRAATKSERPRAHSRTCCVNAGRLMLLTSSTTTRLSTTFLSASPVNSFAPSD